MGVYQSIVSLLYFKMILVLKMIIIVQVWVGGSVVFFVLMIQFFVSGRYGNCNIGFCIWGSIGFCSFMVGRIMDGQGWMEFIVFFVYLFYRQGK